MKGIKFVSIENLRHVNRDQTVRIGTAAEYRVPDGRDGARSDPQEMIRGWSPGDFEQTVDKHHPVFGKIIKDMSPTKVKIAQGTTLALVTNVYMFCVSETVTEKMRNRMERDFDCDTFYEIRNLEKFAEAVSKQAPEKLGAYEIGKIQYLSMPKASADPEWVNDMWSKDEKFSWQREIRIVWQPVDEGKEGFVIRVPNLRNMIRRRKCI